jgi:hypothetical protein
MTVTTSNFHDLAIGQRVNIEGMLCVVTSVTDSTTVTLRGISWYERIAYWFEDRFPEWIEA